MIDLASEEGITVLWQDLSDQLGCPIVQIDGRLGGGIDELVRVVRDRAASLPQSTEERLALAGQRQTPNWNAEEKEAVHHEINALLSRVCKKPESPNISGAFARTGQLDRILLHETWGLSFLILAMVTLFSSIFWLAAPLMDFVDQSFGWLAGMTYTLLGQGMLADFVSNGLITGAGAVLVFVPQILILFLGIGLLEDSGYLARAATIVDRPLARMGLNGRAFVPILSGFACAVPAMLAARTISSRKERLITLAILPFMTCSARLPVYALLLSFLFLGDAPWKPGIVLAAIYVASFFVGALSAALLSRLIPQTESTMFLLELPYYRRPQPKVIAANAYHRTLSYVKRAGPVIFILAVALWLAGTFPHSQEPSETVRLEKSYLGQVGEKLEPVFQPMGLDWRVGVSLLTAFAAREVFVSNLAVLMSSGSSEGSEDEEASLRQNLILKMKDATNRQGEPIFTLSSVLGLIVFFMLALQCTATTAMAAREAGSWKFAIIQLVAMNILAYVLACGLVQGLRGMGVA
jgi:ferrous iron transport protein B